MTDLSTIAELFPKFEQINQHTIIPKQGIVEPFLKLPRALWMLPDELIGFNEDGSRLTHPCSAELPELMRRVQADFGTGLVLETYVEPTRLLLRDAALIGKRLPLISRMLLLDEIVNSLCSETIWSVERLSVDDFYVLIEAGYQGFVIRNLDHEYMTSAGIVAVPTTISSLTCLAIREDAIFGSGILKRKKVKAIIEAGLKESQKKTLFTHQRDYIGKKFEVLSCGNGPGGSLMFPILQHWKD